MQFGVGEQERVGPWRERVKVDHEHARLVPRDVDIQHICKVVDNDPRGTGAVSGRRTQSVFPD